MQGSSKLFYPLERILSASAAKPDRVLILFSDVSQNVGRMQLVRQIWRLSKGWYWGWDALQKLRSAISCAMALLTPKHIAFFRPLPYMLSLLLSLSFLWFACLGPSTCFDGLVVLGPQIEEGGQRDK